MEIISRVPRMSAISAKLLAGDVQIGLVPTRGGIHPGHLSLIAAAREMTDLVVVSIFVDRMPFCSDEDYRQYPRDLTEDIDLLSQQNVDYVFSPSARELFPRNLSTFVQVENFGARLPGMPASAEFKAMTTTALKMIHIVRPAFLFLGLKDALQSALLRKMIQDLNLGTEIVVAPVVRQASGLAYSVRNCLLTEPERDAASVLYRSLMAAQEAIAGGERQAKQLTREIARVVQAEPLAKLEYAFVTDPESLEPVGKLRGSALIGVCARVGASRLNDAIMAQIPTE